MVPYLERLGPEGRDRFFADYRERVRARWPERPVFFPFNRTLLACAKET
jgi:trans-aconitate methyltransferase